MQGSVTPPINVCRKRHKTIHFNGSEWNVYRIIPHVLTKKMSTHNNSLFCIGAQIWAFLCWYKWHKICRLCIRKINYYTLHFIPHIWYCHRLISYNIFVFLQSYKVHLRLGWYDFKPKKWPNWSCFAEIMIGGRGRFKIKKTDHLLISWHVLCVLLHNTIELGKES